MVENDLCLSVSLLNFVCSTLSNSSFLIMACLHECFKGRLLLHSFLFLRDRRRALLDGTRRFGRLWLRLLGRRLRCLRFNLDRAAVFKLEFDCFSTGSNLCTGSAFLLRLALGYWNVWCFYSHYLVAKLVGLLAQLLNAVVDKVHFTHWDGLFRDDISRNTLSFKCFFQGMITF